MTTDRNKHFIFLYRQKGVKGIIKLILLPFYDIVFALYILFFGKHIKKKKYYLSLCTVFKNEAAYLREWIEYHLLIGVEHFYLYNNLSNDTYYEKLQSYIDRGQVTLYDWPAQQPQSSVYEHCFKKHSNDTSWLFCIDVDEFTVPKYETSLIDWLKPYEKYPAVAIHWKFFGTSGMLKRPEKSLVTETYTVCWNKLHNLAKVIFNTSYTVYDYKNHHLFHARIYNVFALPPVNEFKQPLGLFIARWSLYNPESTIQLNHYWSKSYSEFIEKQGRGDVFYKESPYNKNYFLFHETKNMSVDYTIYRFIIQLKQSLNVSDETV
jgi:hypothetical protein